MMNNEILNATDVAKVATYVNGRSLAQPGLVP